MSRIPASSTSYRHAASGKAPALPQELQSLLDAVRDDQSNFALFSELLVAATQYVKNDKGKDQHIYCSNGRPCDFDLESCMLRVLSFSANDEIEFWKNRICKGIYSNCLDCYQGFLYAKDHLRDIYLNTYAQEQRNAFFDFFDLWEEHMALEVLNRAKQTPGTPLKRLSRTEIYAVFTLVASPKAIKLNQLIKEMITADELTSVPSVPAGFLTLCLEEDVKLRMFAARQMYLLKPLPLEPQPPSVIMNAIDRVAQRYSRYGAMADWERLPILLSTAPIAAVTLTSAILSHVHDRHERFAHVLKAYATLLKLRGPAVWKDDTDTTEDYSTLILSGILDNPYFTKPLFESAQTVNNDRERVFFFGWMRPHLDSLRHTGGKRLSEAIKRLANFLFERMQQGHVPNECRAFALTEGVDLVLNHADEVNSRDVVNLYALPIAQIALSRESKADSKTKVAAQQLIYQAFKRDSQNLAAATLELSRISKSYNKKIKSARQAARLAKAGKAVSKDDPITAVFDKAARETFPVLEICHELWSETYKVTAADSNKEGVAILLEALSITTVYTMPSAASHVMKKPSGQDNASYEIYAGRVRESVKSLTKAFDVMRGSFFETLTDFGELAREGEVQDLCTASAHSILLLNLCPEPSIYKSAQNLLRMAFSSVETRSDCFRILFQLNSSQAFRAMGDYLSLFINAANNLIEANDLAKWMVRSFADIINVLAGSTDGVLRPGNSWSLVENRSTLQTVALKAPTIFRLMCESVAAIFKRTPSWSILLAREDLVAWFRDVTMFASDMVDTLPVFCQLLRRAAETPSTWMGKQKQEDEDNVEYDPSEEEAMAHALALPLEVADSWLRMNDLEILHETQSFIFKTLDQFGSDHDLPTQARDNLLDFINEQLLVTDADARHTLLSLEELKDMKARLEQASPIVISDDDEDVSASDSDTKAFPLAARSDTSERSSKVSVDIPTIRTSGVSSSYKSEPDTSHWWTGVGLLKPSSSQETKRKKLKQLRLNFNRSGSSDTSSLNRFAEPDRNRAVIKHDFTKTKLRQSVPSAPINAYRGASARTAGASSSRAGTGKIAQLRQELGSSNSWKAQTANARSTSDRWGRNNDDEVLVKAPAAVSSVTGTLINKMPPPSTEAAKAAARKARGSQSDTTSSSSSESDSSDDDAEAKGLAALRAQTDRPRTFKVTQPERRQLKVLEDPHLLRARQERAEAERKRILRSPPDYSALHRSILAWNYFHEGDRPPAIEGQEPEYKRIQPHFTNAGDYGSVFGPLLLLESWSQFQSAKEEAMTSNEPTIAFEVTGRTTVDQFVDVNISIASDSLPQSYNLAETDILRLTERISSDAARKPRIVLAKVQTFKRHPQGHQATLRCCLVEDRQGASTALVDRSKWELKKFFSLTTIHREFAALMAAPYFELFSDIVKARLAPKATISASDLKNAMEGYQVNEPQARAIIGSLATDGFSLIQGPPGTGKTKTICALIGAFVSNRRAPSTTVQAGFAAGKVNASKKILLCAPSNAAIDEVAKRAKAGMRLLNGQLIYPKVVRIGRDDNINISVRDVSLNYLIDQRLAGGSTSNSGDGKASAAADPSVLHAEIRQLKIQREEKIAEHSANRGNKALAEKLQAEIRNLAAKRLAVMSRLDEAKDKAQSAHRQREADRRRARAEILGDADVICTTLSGAGHEMLSTLSFDFETVVIDEAAQAVELSTIIPLRYGCKQCIMVGDPNQLPPTVLSQQASQLGYSQSLFVRMYERMPSAVHLLSIQYRMHPEIALFPSQAFYDGKLLNGANMAELTRQPWHQYDLMRPLKFLSTTAPETPGRSHSLINREEASIALALYERLRIDFPAVNLDFRIGVVTMYKAQVFELKRVFQNRYGHDIAERIDFNTVDGFQGQEKDIIILSCVRSSHEPRSIGFLSDRRRLNVALTRAKSNLFIIGNAEHLKRSDQLWNKLVTTAEQVGALQPITVSLLQKGSKKPAKQAPAIVPQFGSPAVVIPQQPASRPSSPIKAQISKPHPATTPNHASPLPSRPNSSQSSLAQQAANNSAFQTGTPPGPAPSRPASFSTPAPPNSFTKPTNDADRLDKPSSVVKSKVNGTSLAGTAGKASPGTSIAADRNKSLGAQEPKRKLIVSDEPIRKKIKVNSNGSSAEQSMTNNNLPKKPSKFKGQPPMKAPRLSNGAKDKNGTAKQPTRHDPVGHLSVGVLKKPSTPIQAPPPGATDRPVINRTLSPPKPSNAALNALFVKKRK